MVGCLWSMLGIASSYVVRTGFGGSTLGVSLSMSGVLSSLTFVDFCILGHILTFRVWALLGQWSFDLWDIVWYWSLLDWAHNGLWIPFRILGYIRLLELMAWALVIGPSEERVKWSFTLGVG